MNLGQKTLGHRTQCSECEMVQGQFCGDCLFMRYGEHVLEGLENPNWVCPVCRGICNCSLCRNHNGWAPTGPMYRMIAELGYKSVAHYLIQTKRSKTDDATTPNQASTKRSLAFQVANPLPEQLPNLLQNMENQNGGSLKKEEDENTNEDPNSVKKSPSFFLPSVNDQTPLVDAEDKALGNGAETGGNSLSTPENRRETRRASHDQALGNRTESGGNSVNTRENRRETRTKRRASQDQALGNETETGSNSVTTTPESHRETRSKKRASLEPNPDSIGARLRQRQMVQSGQ